MDFRVSHGAEIGSALNLFIDGSCTMAHAGCMHQTLEAQTSRKENYVAKNPHAVALGRLGGKAKVPKGVHLLPPERRSEIARNAALAMHAKKKAKKAVDS